MADQPENLMEHRAKHIPVPAAAPLLFQDESEAKWIFFFFFFNAENNFCFHFFPSRNI